jgi:NADP-dependent 3-hydroxy acid dehydrogenase YdfG
MSESNDPRVFFITGCSTGIGRALALEARSRGHRVFATARRVESLAELEAQGVETSTLDVTRPETITEAIATAIQGAGRIDVLVNNAGLSAFGPLVELPLEELRRVFDTNVLGLMAVTQAAFPHMADARSGLIVNVGSVVGHLPTPFAGIYCASKSAVHMLSDVLRMEVAPFGIRVLVVEPGGVKSSIADSGARGIERFADASSRYRKVYPGIQKRAHASQDGPMPAEAFAAELIERLLEPAPPRVVRLGTGADTLPRLAELPGEQRDALLSANYGLGDLFDDIAVE